MGASPALFHDHDHGHECQEAHVNEHVDACHISIHHGIQVCNDHDHLQESEYCTGCALFFESLPIAHISFLSTAVQSSSSEILVAANEHSYLDILAGTDCPRGPPSIM